MHKDKSLWKRHLKESDSSSFFSSTQHFINSPYSTNPKKLIQTEDVTWIRDKTFLTLKTSRWLESPFWDFLTWMIEHALRHYRTNPQRPYFYKVLWVLRESRKVHLPDLLTACSKVGSFYWQSLVWFFSAQFSLILNCNFIMSTPELCQTQKETSWFILTLDSQLIYNRKQ